MLLAEFADSELDLRLATEVLAEQDLHDKISWLLDDLFDEVYDFYFSDDPLAAALCSRRAGKTRNGIRAILYLALITRNGQFFYVNTTRDEIKRLVWHGNDNDGFVPLIHELRKRGLDIHMDNVSLKIHCRHNNAWIHCVPVSDEKAVQKMLGAAIDLLWWDESQKVPPKLTATIISAIMPTFADRNGKLRLTGTPINSHTSWFFEITQPDVTRRPDGWRVFHWWGAHNPHFGKTYEERRVKYVAVMMKYLNCKSEDDSLMQREAFGRWTFEDANHVYAVHRVARETLCYRRHVETPLDSVGSLLEHLPGWGSRDYFLALGLDLGYSPDPFALTIWAWSLRDSKLYEVYSYKQAGLTSDEQADVIQRLRRQMTFAVIVADAGGPAKPTVQGWIKGWQERYPIPVEEAKKSDKHSAIERVNSDILGGNMQLCEGSPLHAEMLELQWSKVATATGRIVEEASQANHCCDAALYAHRHSYHHRYLPEPAKPEVGSEAYWEQKERELMEAQ